MIPPTVHSSIGAAQPPTLACTCPPPPAPRLRCGRPRWLPARGLVRPRSTAKATFWTRSRAWWGPRLLAAEPTLRFPAWRVRRLVARCASSAAFSQQAGSSGEPAGQPVRWSGNQPDGHAADPFRARSSLPHSQSQLAYYINSTRKPVEMDENEQRVRPCLEGRAEGGLALCGAAASAHTHTLLVH